MRRLRAVRTVLALVAVALTALVLYWPFVRVLLFHARSFVLSGVGGDEWLYIYFFRIEVEKLLGLDVGGLWNGAFYYPLHEQSLLFTEPQWGVSIALFPIWLLSHDEFLTLGAGVVIAMVAGWVAAFAFARHLGASRIAAAAAAIAFGTSGAFLALLIRPFFWPLPLLALLLVVTDCVCLSSRRKWIGAFAVLFGVLSWSSCHLTVMGIVLVALQAGFCFVSGVATRGAGRRLVIAAACAAVLVAIPFVPQVLALLRNGFERTVDAQAHPAANLSSFLLAPSTSGSLLARSGLPAPTGEFVIGLPPLALAFATIAFVVAIVRAGGNPARPRRRAIVPLLAAALPGVIAAVAIPGRMGMLTMNRWATGVVYATAGIVIVLLRGRLARVLRSPAGWFFACGLLFAILSVGPVFKLDDVSGIPSPALLVCRLPGMSGIRASTRWSLLCAFCLAVSTAMALDAGRSRKLTLAGMAAFVLALGLDAWHPTQPMPEFPPHSETWQPRTVDVFLRDAKGPGAVLEIPVSARQSEAERMISRLFHRRPLVNGYSGMIPAFHSDHWVGPTAQIHEIGTLDSTNIELLRAFGARFWVVHRDQILRPEVRANVPDAFGPLTKIASLDGGRVLVYEDPAPKARPPR